MNRINTRHINGADKENINPYIYASTTRLQPQGCKENINPIIYASMSRLQPQGCNQFSHPSPRHQPQGCVKMQPTWQSENNLQYLVRRDSTRSSTKTKSSTRKHKDKPSKRCVSMGCIGPMPQACSTFIDPGCDISNVPTTNSKDQFIPIMSSTLNHSICSKFSQCETIHENVDSVVTNDSNFCVDMSRSSKRSSSNRFKKVMKRLHSTPNTTIVPSIHLDTSYSDSELSEDSSYVNITMRPQNYQNSPVHHRDSRQEPFYGGKPIVRAQTTPNLHTAKDKQGGHFPLRQNTLKKFNSLPSGDQFHAQTTVNSLDSKAAARKITLDNYFSSLCRIDEQSDIRDKAVVKDGLVYISESTVLKKIQKLSKTLRRKVPSQITTLATL